jgi:hypothetical protein
VWALAVAACAIACSSPCALADASDDAVSRELSVYASADPAPYAIPDAVSRGITVYASSDPAAYAITDAVSREITLYASRNPAPYAITDTVSREITLYASADTRPYAVTDAFSREISICNSLDNALSDAISRELTVFRESLIHVKARPDGSPAILSGGDCLAVTAAFADCIYVEATDRSAGIKVTGAVAAEGAQVNVTGVIRTGDNGERYIDASQVTEIGTASAEPLGAITRALFCGDFAYDKATGAGQQGMAHGAGLNLVGMLVRSAGQVASVEAGSFHLSDGFATSVRVMLPPGVTAPSSGAAVSVTGVLTTEKNGTNLYPVLRPRRSTDITAE